MDRRLPPAIVLENTRAVVKWFNTRKGYGFVRIAAVDRDALLHISVLSRIGRETVAENATMICDISEDRRGWQVSTVHKVDDSIVSASSHRGAADSAPVNGVVKFFSQIKEFGFIAPENGGPDVFISGHILDRCGVAPLRAEQRVRVVVRDGTKGPQAVQIESVP